MKKLKNALVLILALSLTLSLIGCGTKVNTSEKDADGKTEASEENEDSSITITDTEGREIVLDAVPDSVATIGSALRLYTYVSGTDNLCGVEHVQQKGEGTPRPYFMAYPEIADIQIIGEGKNQAPEAELLLEANPDVIFAGDTMDVGSLDELQNKIGIPIIIITGGTDNKIANDDMIKSLNIIGKAMGKEERATDVINFLKKCEEDLNNRTKDIPDDEKPTMYVGGLAWSGYHGIESTTANSPLLSTINAKNVADEIDAENTFDVDKEQILEWDPEYLFIDSAGYDLVMDDVEKKPELYNNLSAVKSDKVYMHLAYTNNYHNYETAIADAYYFGSVLYPDAFSDIDPVVKADEIYEFMLGTPVYDQMASLCGGYGKISLK